MVRAISCRGSRPPPAAKKRASRISPRTRPTASSAHVGAPIARVAASVASRSWKTCFRRYVATSLGGGQRCLPLQESKVPRMRKHGTCSLTSQAIKNRRGLSRISLKDMTCRYLRVTFLGSSSDSWGSLWGSGSVHGDAPPLPAGVSDAGNGTADRATIADVKAPPEFDVTLFGAPPLVNIRLFVRRADGRTLRRCRSARFAGPGKGQGKILRCVDRDGDGIADSVNLVC